MSCLFRVVPKKKQRKIHPQTRKIQLGLPHIDKWLDGFIVERRTRNLPEDIYASLAAISNLTTYRKNTILFAEGQKPLGAFLVCKGQVKLSASSVDGKSLIVGKAAAGDLLGIPNAISGRPNEATAEAVQPVQCNFVGRDTFLRFLRKHRSAAFGVAELLSDMYSSTFYQLRDLGLGMTAEQKLARLLLDLASTNSTPNGHRKHLLTHKEIGELIGVSRETVSRLFARFKKEQLVRIHDSGLRILNREGLERLVAA